ncbi:MAG: tetratricopeptide repeat protein, partial [Chloroflexota bacterium]
LDDSALVNQYLACVRFWIPMSNRQREMRELIVQSYEQYHQREDIPDHHKGNIYTVYACAIAFDLHDYERATQAFDEGIAFLEKADATIDLLDTVYFKSVMKRIQGDFSAILELNQRAYDLAESIDQPSLMARSASAIAFSIGTLKQDISLSLDWYEKAYQLGKKVNNRSIVAVVSNNLGSNHLMLGNYDKARTYLESAQEYNTAPLRPALLVIINRNLAELDIQDGNLGQAEERYLESVRVTDAYRKYDDQIMAHYVLAGFYYAIARYDDLYETIAKLRTIANNNITSEQTYQTIDAFEAMAKIGQGDWDAIPTIEQAVTNLAKLSDPNFYVNLLGAWVAVLIHQADYQRALEILSFIRSLPFWSKTMENTPVIQSSLTTLQAHFSPDDYERISSSWQGKKYVDVVAELSNSTMV